MLESQVVLNYYLGFFYVTPITLRLLKNYNSKNSKVRWRLLSHGL